MTDTITISGDGIDTARRQLQLFDGLDGRRPAAAKLTIGGSVDLESHDDRDHALAARLQFGRRVAVVLIVGDEEEREQAEARVRAALGDNATVIDGMVTKKGHTGKLDGELEYLDAHTLQIGIKLGGLSHGGQAETEEEEE